MSERVFKVEPDADKSFNSCNDCIYAADPEAICRIRQCVHAFSRLAECYRPRSKNKSMTYEGLVYTAWSQTLVAVEDYRKSIDTISDIEYENGRADAANDILQIMQDNIKQVLEKEANG